MDFSSTPFLEHNGIEPCEDPPHGIFALNPDPLHFNHLESIHQSSVFSLAECSSGAFLMENLESFTKDDFVYTLREAKVRYRAATNEKVYTIGKRVDIDWGKFHSSLQRNGRGLIRFPIHVMNMSGKCVSVCEFEWFLFRKPQRKVEPIV
ncbi:MAG: DUF4442 domain-containing protein [Opitutales bacterium]|nr:DUF4442 domain-containing protein [Opitutales bacterium]